MTGKGLLIPVLLVILALSFTVPPVWGATKSLHIVKYANDGSTVLKETNIDYTAMEQRLPVQGDGTTHYYLQGPVFATSPDSRWNPAEDTNVKEKDMGAVKGTDLRDLCELVGGMKEEDEITVRANDGYSRTYSYENVYDPPSRQGSMVIAWYHDKYGYVPSYSEGMRLVFFADSSTNPWGYHALGSWDWHESAAEKYWYFYYQGGEKYPTTTGLSVRYVSELQIQSQDEPEGTIQVNSTPVGATLFIDDEETGDFTPCSVTVPVGIHTVRVEKPGYSIPDELSVEVLLGRTSSADFILRRETNAGSLSGDSLSGDSSDNGELTGKESVLSLYSVFEGRGNLTPFPLVGLEGIIQGGEERSFRILPPAGYHPGDFVRLYIFSSEGRDKESRGPARPVFSVTNGSVVQAAEREYTAIPGNGSLGTSTTSCFNLTGLGFLPNSSWILKMAGEKSVSAVLEGGMAVFAIQSQNTTSQAGFLFEGTEPVDPPSIGTAIKDESVVEASLEEVNPVTYTEILAYSTLTTESIPLFESYLDEESVKGAMRCVTRSVWEVRIENSRPKSGSFLSFSLSPAVSKNISSNWTTRLIIMNVAGKPGVQIVTQAAPSVNMTTIMTLIQTPKTTVQTMPVTSVQSRQAVPGWENRSRSGPTVPFGTGIFSIFTAFMRFLGLYPNVSPVELAGEIQPLEDHDDLTMNSSHGSVNDSSIQDIPSGSDTNLSMMGNPGPDASILQKHSKANSDRVARSGGAYITSFPSGADIWIDGKIRNCRTPCVIYGLKEGLHTIEVKPHSESGASKEGRTTRIWIYPQVITAVDLDLNYIEDGRILRVKAPENMTIGFTVSGYYPLLVAPLDVVPLWSEEFITVMKEGIFLSVEPDPVYKDIREVEIPADMPDCYQVLFESEPPDAEIILDGYRTGSRTPVTFSNISSGIHRVIVVKEGYLPKSDILRIPVSSDRVIRKSLRVTLMRSVYGALFVNSTPPGASVTIDGLPTGEKTPSRFPYMTIGLHEVKTTLRNETSMREVMIYPEKNESIRMDLTSDE